MTTFPRAVPSRVPNERGCLTMIAAFVAIVVGIAFYFALYVGGVVLFVWAVVFVLQHLGVL